MPTISTKLFGRRKQMRPREERHIATGALLSGPEGALAALVRLGKAATAVLASIVFLGTAPNEARAYPVDCAILLCLAGGWPASAECAHARAVFIRRITPWPIEPPLQIWNCPMRAGFVTSPELERLLDVSVRAGVLGRVEAPRFGSLAPMPVASQADVDISGPAFDFVRSIRVFEITYAQRRGKEGECYTSSSVYLGSYGRQGDYVRRRSSVGAVPRASDLNRPGECSAYKYRSVFVEWRDMAKHYGHEEVRY
jgi:hypothetical protein